MDSLIMKMVETVTKEWDPTIVQRKRIINKGHTRYLQVAVKAAVWQRDKGKCINCGSSYALELDHLHPYSLGGRTKSDNLQLLCRNCNQRKSYEMFKRSYK